MLSVALRVPPADGVNVTLMEQLEDGASVEEQLLVCEKSLEFVPAMPIPAIVRVPEPGLDRVTSWEPLVLPTGWPAKVTPSGATLAEGQLVVQILTRNASPDRGCALKLVQPLHTA